MWLQLIFLSFILFKIINRYWLETIFQDTNQMNNNNSQIYILVPGGMQFYELKLAPLNIYAFCSVITVVTLLDASLIID